MSVDGVSAGLVGMEPVPTDVDNVLTPDEERPIGARLVAETQPTTEDIPTAPDEAESIQRDTSETIATNDARIASVSQDMARHLNVAPEAVTPVSASAPTSRKGLGFLQAFADHDAFKQRFKNQVASWESEASGLDGALDEAGLLEFKERRLTQLFTLQMEMNDIALNVEMMSKLIEHATGSVKTALQTQT